MVSDPRYDWKRFWYPKGGNWKPDFAGYLDDPESSYAYITNLEVVPFAAMSGTPCLILLGEPGSGKSIALDQAFEEAKGKGKPALKFGLRGYDSSSELSNEIFGNPVFQDWLNDSYHLDLFLDSLDEGLLSLSVLSDILTRKLKNFPCERLNLRLTCRTADWRGTLEENLRQIWGKDDVGVYELAPLRRVDVEEAAGKNYLHSEAFIREIQARGAEPLAIQPITLKFLLRIYREDYQFPSTRKELYYKGCRNFCDENNPYRREAGKKGKLDIDKRMMIAGRIAAVIVFANRVAIWIGSGEAPSKNYISIQELCGTELLDEREFSVTETAIEEVLKITSLFSSYGDGHNSFCFTHQTYAEFLAAWYIEQHPMTLAQRMSLLQHPADPDRKLVSQLHQVAAWAASLLPEVFQEIVKIDPDVALQSDIENSSQENCAALVESLLKLHNEEKLLYEPRSWLYRRLKNKNLIAQVQPYISDTTKSEDARYVAIDIARACQLEVLQHDLANVAIDPSQPYWVRVNAAYAVSEIGDIETKKILKPLALGEAGDDPDNELKGYGLQATYPSHMKAEEVFNVLTQPNGNYFGGTYQNFIARNFAEHLQVADLPLALAWVEAQQSRRELRYPFTELSDAIIFLAWEHLESPGILEAFAKITSKKWDNRQIIKERHKPSFDSLLLDNDAKRRLLLEMLVSMISSSTEEHPDWLFFGYRTQVIIQKDFLWIIEQLQSSDSKDAQKIWAQLIQRTFRSPECSPDKVNIILSISRTNKVLHEVFEEWIEPMKLGSPEAIKVRDFYRKEQEGLSRDNNQLEPSLIDRIIACLEKFESGNLNAWCDLNMEIMLMPNSMYHTPFWNQPDITASNGWQIANSLTRSRIVSAAEKFIRERQQVPQNFLSLSKADLAGYKALRLLLKERPHALLNLNVETWEIWSPVIINTYSILSGSQYVEPHLELTKLAYSNASTKFINTLIAQIDKENERDRNIFITRSIKNFWDERLAAVLLKKLEDPVLKPESVGQLLEVLLGHKVFAAKKIAETLILSPHPSEREPRSKAIVAARALIFDAEDAGWTIIWSAIQKDPGFGREVLESVSYFARETRSIEWRLSENQVLELYKWLARQYPKIEKPKRQRENDDFSVEDYEVKPKESANRWQSVILQHLKERGTPQACEALQQIAREFPDMAEKLKRVLLEAQLITRRRTWSAPTPQEVLKVTSDRNVRLVNGADQLLDVVIESLNNLNQELQGETPSAFLLWDPSGSRPRDEHTLSDYVQLHLKRDIKQRGIITKREVEIRRRHGEKSIAAPGERLDLQVDAFVRSPSGEIYDCVSIIIEVKGCWNEKLDTAMKEQLIDRYLNDNKCQHGLYLIGWFNCNQWDRKDSKKPPNLNIEEARQRFETQAAELSKQGVKVRAVVLDTSLR